MGSAWRQGEITVMREERETEEDLVPKGGRGKLGRVSLSGDVVIGQGVTALN